MSIGIVCYYLTYNNIVLGLNLVVSRVMSIPPNTTLSLE